MSRTCRNCIRDSLLRELPESRVRSAKGSPRTPKDTKDREEDSPQRRKDTEAGHEIRRGAAKRRSTAALERMRELKVARAFTHPSKSAVLIGLLRRPSAES
jgi:hypothetical protein